MLAVGLLGSLLLAGLRYWWMPRMETVTAGSSSQQRLPPVPSACCFPDPSTDLLPNQYLGVCLRLLRTVLCVSVSVPLCVCVPSVVLMSSAHDDGW
mgnify:CR=1 FL=1